MISKVDVTRAEGKASTEMKEKGGRGEEALGRDSGEGWEGWSAVGGYRALAPEAKQDRVQEA